jgi:hypothetical protein
MTSHDRQNRPRFPATFLKFKGVERLQQAVFLLASAHSVHIQPVPINSSLGYSENPYAKFSCPLMRKKEYSYSEWPGQSDGRRVSLSTSMYDG